MKINDVIAEVRSLCRGRYEDAQLMKWLSDVDALIYKEIIKTHEGAPDGEFVPYTDGESELIVPYVYGELYRLYLQAQIYLSNGEINDYNNSAALYAAARSKYANWYNRTHMPNQPKHYITY